MRKLLLIPIVLAILLGLAPSAGATYDQQFLLSQDSVFLHQVTAAEVITSVAVLAEAPTVAGHLSRSAFAGRVIADPQKYAPIIAIVIASQTNNPMTPLTLPSTVTDTLVQTAMNAQWTNMSGYFSQ
jgi:hypothetical protein